MGARLIFIPFFKALMNNANPGVQAGEMQVYRLLILTLILLIASQSAVSQSTKAGGGERQHYHHDLLDDLLGDYCETERPKRNASQPVMVAVRLSLNSIIDLKWVDDYLQWEPADYGGLDMIKVPKDRIWLPDINVYQRINWVDVQALEQVLTNPRVTHEGLVTVQEPRYLVSTCVVNVTYFPFDQHQCKINIGSWTHSPSELDVKIGRHANGTFAFKSNPEWDLVKYQVQYNRGTEEVGEYSELVFTLHVRRRPYFMLINTALPTSFISCLTLITFLMPCETGEKMGYGITLFLALCVNLLTISSMLPAGEVLPIIQNFLCMCISLVAFSLISTVVVLRLYHTDESQPVPDCVKRLFGIKSPHFPTTVSLHSVNGKFNMSSDHFIPEKQPLRDDGFKIHHHRAEPPNNASTVKFNSSITPDREKLGSGSVSPDLTAAINNLTEALETSLEVNRLREMGSSINGIGSAQKSKSDWMRLAERVDRVMAVTFIIVYCVTLVYLVHRMRKEVYMI